MKEKQGKSLIKKLLVYRKRLIILAIVLSAGFLIWKFALGKKEEIETTKIERGTVSEELVLSGEISADEYAKLTFPTSGKISWVGVSEGNEVKRGQALAKLDTTVLNAAFQQARAALRAAEATVEKDHAGDETFTQKDTRTAAEAAKDEAYDAYIAAEYNLRNSTLTSPFAGIVTFLAHPFSGVNVLVTETQVEVINPDTIYFDVSADQTEVGDLSIDQKVKIILDSMPDEELSGYVDFISYTPRSGEVGTVYKVKVKFDGKLDVKKYRIGMSGDASFILSEKESILYLPPKFVKSDSQGKYVKLGKKNNKTYIEVGIEGEDKIEIKGDIKEGDIVFD